MIKSDWYVIGGRLLKYAAGTQRTDILELGRGGVAFPFIVGGRTTYEPGAGITEIPTGVYATPVVNSHRVTIRSSMWRATIANAWVEDISDALVDGSVEYLSDRAIPMTGRFEFVDSTRFTPYRDYLAPAMTLEWEDGTTATYQLGLFATQVPRETVNQTRAVAEVEGLDLTSVLANAAFTTPYNIASGTNYVTAIGTLLTDAGFTRFLIPTTSKTLAQAKTFPPGMSKLDAVNALLQSIGYYNLWADRTGILTSQPYVALNTVQPALTMTDASNAVVGDIDRNPTLTTLANVVIVVKDRPSEAPLTATRRNDDPASPTSTVALGREIVRVVSDQELADQNAVDALADRLTQEWGSYYETVQVQTMPDPSRNPREVYEMNLTIAGNRRLAGRYICRGWQLGFTPKTSTMTHQLARVVTLA